MADYVIRVDGSTRRGGDNGYGDSTAAWMTWIRGSLIASGLIYFTHQGPNKAVYEGIIAALSQLERDHFYPAGSDDVTVFIDCEPVLTQLNSKRSALKMKPHLERVRELCQSHPNVTFRFIHENEQAPEFKRVDQLSKMGLDWIRKR